MNPDDEQKSPEQDTHTWHDTQPEPAVMPPIDTDKPVQFQKPKRSFKQKLGALLRSRKFWLITVALLIAALIALWFIQPTRWWIANLFGKNTLTITTIAPGEGQAKVSRLGNVAVTVNGQSYKTDNQGKLTVPNVPYGKASITTKKAGYQDVTYGVTLDFDPFFHKFGGEETDNAARTIELSLPATGIPVAFKVIDSLSGKPVTSGEFMIGDVVAKPDDQGLVSVKIPGTDASKVNVSSNFAGKYNDQKFDITLGGKTTPEIKVVPAGKHYFISKRDGVLTVYGSNLDGSDVQPIVVGTGQENDQTAFAVSPDGKFGVLSSSRDGARTSNKDLLQRLYVVDLTTKQLTRVDEGIRITFADWAGSTLVYAAYTYDSTAGGVYNTTLKSVDASSKRVYSIESNADTVMTVAFDRVVYQRFGGSDSPVLRVANSNGSSQRSLGEKVGYNDYIQLDFDRVAFKTEQDQSWHEYNLNTDQLKSIAQPSSGSNTVRYIDSYQGNGEKRLLVDRIDGKDTLQVKDMNTGAITPLYGEDGLGGPIRWIGDVVTFRVVNDKETADYAISLNGGKPHKIADVTATVSTQGAAVDRRFRFY